MSAEDILGVVAELGFEPTVVATPGKTSERGEERVDLAQLPQEYQALFADARRTDRPVLLDFTAPG